MRVTGHNIFPLTTQSSNSLSSLPFFLAGPHLTCTPFTQFPACFPDTTLIAAMAMGCVCTRMVARVGSRSEFHHQLCEHSQKWGRVWVMGHLGGWVCWQWWLVGDEEVVDGMSERGRGWMLISHLP